MKRQREALQSAFNRMEQSRNAAEDASGQGDHKFTINESEEITHALLEAVDAERKAEEDCRRLTLALDKLRLWGQFDASVLERLKQRGWNVLLCRTQRKAKLLQPKDVEFFDVGGDRQQRCFIAISRNELSKSTLPAESFPCGMDMHAVEAQLADAKERSRVASEKIDECALKREAVLMARKRIEDAITFEATRSGMGKAGKMLTYLSGYIPVSKLDELRRAANRYGWAVRYEDVADDDMAAPTKLCLPKPFRMAQCILDFIGVLPGYHEVDVSVSVLFWLTFFCGMLVGDAGYGLVFTLLTGVALFKKRKEPSRGLPFEVLQLLFAMSASILVWGSLSGTWFGLAAGGLPWLADDANGDHIKLFCFFLVATHLSFARLWKSAICASWRDRLGNIGWAIFMWANFFTVKALLVDNSFAHFTFPTYLYAISGVMILLFAIDWKSFGDVIYSPFNFINSVSDVLSYIRLYAVGLSSLYIAKAFNDMAVSIWSANRWLIPVGLIVLLFGHLLNIALAAMGVLVHGIRLNTLEFSSHIGIDWCGRAYTPFK